jgi:hypothetical protein
MNKYAIRTSGQAPRTVEADNFYFDGGFVVFQGDYNTENDRKNGLRRPVIAAYQLQGIQSITIMPVEESPYGGYQKVPSMDAVKKPLQHRRKASVKGKK